MPKATVGNPAPSEEEVKRAERQQKHLYKTLDALVNQLPDFTSVKVIHGKAKGADSLAGEWAKTRGYEVIEFPAQWNLYGKAAGYYRNTQMLEEGEPDVVIVFPGGKGTEMMASLSKKVGVETIQVSDI